MKYVATINLTEQVAEDHWIYRQHLKEVSGDTSLNEIIDWAYTKVSKHDAQKDGFKLPDVTIRPVE